MSVLLGWAPAGTCGFPVCSCWKALDLGFIRAGAIVSFSWREKKHGGVGVGKIPEGKGYNESTLQGTWVYVSGRCVTLAINFPSGLPLSVLRSEEGG